MANLKNYTSQVDASKSIAQIERRLCELGAMRVSKDFDRNRKVYTALYFELQLDRGPIAFKIPANIDACFRYINGSRKKKTEDGAKRDWEQAERTAWKTIWDWVDAQAALIEMDQATVAQAFLSQSYNREAGKTLYELVSDYGFPKTLNAYNP